MTDESPGRRCALTAPFHPYRSIRRYISVALALESPPPDVIWHPALRCSDFPHALCMARDHSATLTAPLRYHKKTDPSITPAADRSVFFKMILSYLPDHSITSLPQVSHSTGSPAFMLLTIPEGRLILHPLHLSSTKRESGGTICFLIA